jgi:hypothetical protein
MKRCYGEYVLHTYKACNVEEDGGNHEYLLRFSERTAKGICV